MPAIAFTAADRDNLELVRQIVLRRLRDGRWNQLYSPWNVGDAEEYVTFATPQLHNEFIELMLEAMWQFIAQGVVTPGLNAANPALPWFRVTGYGKKVLAEERFLPHDPTGYLDEVNRVAQSVTGKAAIPYVEEALRCFNAGCSISAVLMLGIAAEAVFLNLCSVISGILKDPADRKAFEAMQWIKPKHKWVVERFEAIPAKDRKKNLPESTDITLSSLYDLIRRQRNEIGHPAEQMPAIGRDAAFTFFKLFPAFIADIEALSKYWTSKGI